MRNASERDFSLFTFFPLGLGNSNKETKVTLKQRHLKPVQILSPVINKYKISYKLDINFYNLLIVDSW